MFGDLACSEMSPIDSGSSLVAVIPRFFNFWARGRKRLSNEEIVLLYWVTAWERLLPKDVKCSVRTAQVWKSSLPASDIFFALSAN